MLHREKQELQREKRENRALIENLRNTIIMQENLIYNLQHGEDAMIKNHERTQMSHKINRLKSYLHSLTEERKADKERIYELECIVENFTGPANSDAILVSQIKSEKETAEAENLSLVDENKQASLEIIHQPNIVPVDDYVAAPQQMDQNKEQSPSDIYEDINCAKKYHDGKSNATVMG